MERLDPNGNYCMYLRKSRADVEAEAHGEGETLARHEHILMKLAKRYNLTIRAVYKEIVSGDTISARPVMQQVLSEVERGLWDGVLVVEVERLARGDTIDQGIVSRAFKISSTLIITPLKIYNPNNEFDEEYFEFGLFMSRREYKTIKRRLNEGRLSSVGEGKYCGSHQPYGYERYKLPGEKGYSLRPVEHQAEVVRMIFDMYTDSSDRKGVAKIVRRLNDLGLKPMYKDKWTPASVRDILMNPVYIGKICWNRRKEVKKIVDGSVTIVRPWSKEYICVEGRHPAIISDEVFNLAQEYRKRNPPRPISSFNVVRNPLSGLIFCKKCGRLMQRRPYSNKTKYDSLICPYTDCKNISSQLNVVEKAIVDQMSVVLNQYIIDIKKNKSPVKTSNTAVLLEEKESELQTLSGQKNKLYDFLEQGIYTTDVFLDRQKEIGDKIVSCQESIDMLYQKVEEEKKIVHQNENFIPKCEHMLQHYYEWDMETRNNVLKELIVRIDYEKNVKNKRGKADEVNFTLEIYPRLYN